MRERILQFLDVVFLFLVGDTKIQFVKNVEIKFVSEFLEESSINF